MSLAHHNAPDAGDLAGMHRLATPHFLELADGGGGAAAVAVLRAGQRSRRMLLLRSLADELSARPAVSGPLPAAAEAWQVLVAAEGADPAAVESVLTHPFAGTWLGAVLRALRGGEPVRWESAGYLHALAAAAGVRSGVPFDLAVPMHAGGVHLPGVGRAFDPRGGPSRGRPGGSPPGVAEVGRGVAGADVAVWWDGGEVVVPGRGQADGPGWWPLREVRSAPGGGAAGRLVVDDLDPWRNFLRPSRPDRLTDAELNRWQGDFAAAWRLVAGQDGVDPGGVAACLLALAPLPAAERTADGAVAEVFSGSAPDSFGGVLMSPPGNPAELAATLVHEAQHVKLSALADLVPLLRGGLAEEHYSPWRGDPRPVRGILQGVYAFLGVCRFWRAVRGAPGTPEELRAAADFEFALRRAQVAEGLRTIRATAEPTDAGAVFLARVTAAADALRDVEVPPEALRAARDAVADHRILYRLAHLRPAAGYVTACARALLAGETRVPDAVREQPRPVLTPGPPVRSTRTALLRGRFTAGLDARGGAARKAAPHPAEGAGLDAYRARLAADPADADAWAGLALALPPGPARSALHAHPEAVAAVHRALPAGHLTPDEVAAALPPSR